MDDVDQDGDEEGAKAVVKEDGEVDEGDGEEGGKDGSKDNNHRRSMDTDSNMGRNRVQGNNTVQDRVQPLIANNTSSP
jgi:hypothetical protein